MIPVIFFHAGYEWFSGGFVGVDIFFVISGYLITTIILNDLEKGKFSILEFYERRIRRLLPALFLVLSASTCIALAIYTPAELQEYGASLSSVAIFLSNFFFWLQVGYFDNSAELKPLLHTWSLAVEEQYYLLFPLGLMILWSRGVRVTCMILLAAFLLSLLLAEITTTNGLHPKISSAAFFLLPARLWELLAGSILALYIRNHGHFHSVILNEFLSLLGLVLIVFSVLFFDSSTPTPSLILLIPVVGACLIILSATSGTSANKILSLPVIVGIGLISYSAYLWHQPILAFLRFFFAEELSNTFLLASLVLIFFAAFLSWRFVEAPFRDRQKFSSSGMFLAASLGICLFSSFGLFLNKSNGLFFSYSDFERRIYGKLH